MTEAPAHTEKMLVSAKKITATVSCGKSYAEPITTDFFCIERSGYFAGGGVALVRNANDAKLFAAAPDLLDALKNTVCYSCEQRLGAGVSRIHVCVSCAPKRALIAKAEGRS